MDHYLNLVEKIKLMQSHSLFEVIGNFKHLKWVIIHQKYFLKGKTKTINSEFCILWCVNFFCILFFFLGIVKHLAHLTGKNISHSHLLVWSVQFSLRNQVSIYNCILQQSSRKKKIKLQLSYYNEIWWLEISFPLDYTSSAFITILLFIIQENIFFFYSILKRKDIPKDVLCSSLCYI